MPKGKKTKSPKGRAAAVVDKTPNMTVHAAVSAVEDRKQSPTREASNQSSERYISASADNNGAKLSDAKNKLNQQVSGGNTSDCSLHPNQATKDENTNSNRTIADTSSKVASSMNDENHSDNAKQNVNQDASHKDEPHVHYMSGQQKTHTRTSFLGSTNSDVASADRDSINNLRAVTTLLSKDSSSSSFPDVGRGGHSTAMLDDDDALLALGQQDTSINSMTIETGSLGVVLPDQPVIDRIISTSPDNSRAVVGNEDCSASVVLAENGRLNDKELHARLELLEQEHIVGGGTRRRESDDDESEADKEKKRQKKEACKQFYPMSSADNELDKEEEGKKNGRRSLMKRNGEEGDAVVEAGMSSQSTTKENEVGRGEEHAENNKEVLKSCVSDGCEKIGAGERQMNKHVIIDNSNEVSKKTLTSSTDGGLARSVSRFHGKSATQRKQNSGTTVKECSKKIVSDKGNTQVGIGKRELSNTTQTNNDELNPGNDRTNDDSTKTFTTKVDITTTCSTFDDNKNKTVATTSVYDGTLPPSPKMTELSRADSNKLSTSWHPDFDTTDDSVSEGSSVFGEGSSMTKFMVTFRWNHTKAKSVFISGSFNDWATDQAMDRGVDDVFEIDLSLRQGKYLYKFIVDGQWFYDITKESEYDAERNVNNVLYV